VTDNQIDNQPSALPSISPGATAHAAGASGPRSGPAYLAFEAARRYATVGLLIILIVVFGFTAPDFLTTANFQDLLISQTVGACVAFAALLPLIIGDFDLSLGYGVGFLAMVGEYVAEHGANAIEITLLMLAGGIIVGLINGLLVVQLRIGAFVATLATGIIMSSLTEGISGGQILFGGVPNVLIDLGRNQFLGLGISVWIVLLLALIMMWVLEHVPVGRRWYAIGGSERVAFLAGVPTRRLRIMAFVVAGLLVAIGSIFQLGIRASADPTFGPELLLPAYAVVFLGVTTHRPGYYNVVGTVVAIVVLAVGFNGLSLLGVPFWVEPLFDGIVLLVAVLAARAEARQVRVGV